jgi:hypothetical protein
VLGTVGRRPKQDKRGLHAPQAVGDIRTTSPGFEEGLSRFHHFSKTAEDLG